MPTTTRLSTHAYELTTLDLQAVRDFALDAPWEWQQLLLSLADRVESADSVADLEQNLDDAEQAVKDALEHQQLAFIEVERRLERFAELLRKALGPGPSELLKAFGDLHRDVLGEMQDVTTALGEIDVWRPAETEQRPTQVAPEADQTKSVTERYMAVLEQARRQRERLAMVKK